MHDEGSYTYADGSVYKGNWVDGMREGEGTESNNKGDCFTGTWSKD